MLKKIGTDSIRKSLGKILDCVNLRGDEFIIARKHEPLAALVPVAKLWALEKMARKVALEGSARYLVTGDQHLLKHVMGELFLTPELPSRRT